MRIASHRWCGAFDLATSAPRLSLRIEPSLKAPIGFADIVEQAGALNDVGQLERQADAARDLPHSPRHRHAVLLQLNRRSAERRFVELTAPGLGRGVLGPQPGHFLAGFHGQRGQRSGKAGPFRLIPPGRRGSGRDRGQNLLHRFVPLSRVDILVAVVVDTQCGADEPAERNAAEALNRPCIERQSPTDEGCVHDGL